MDNEEEADPPPTQKTLSDTTKTRAMMAPSTITTIAHTGTTSPPELSGAGAAAAAALVDVAGILLPLVGVGVGDSMGVIGAVVACGNPGLLMITPDSSP